MGVKGLYNYLKAYRHDIYVNTLPKEPALRIGFDAMSMLYKYKSNYADIFPMLKELKSQGHIVLFVFDGKAPVEKEAEVTQRREARQSAAAQAATLKQQITTNVPTSERERQLLEYSVARLEFQGWQLTKEIRHTFQGLLWENEIPYVKALGEADDVLVDLVGAGKLDVVVSTDMDFLLSAVPRLWIPFRKSYDGFEEVVLQEVLEGEGLTPESLCDTGILCGVEPLRGKTAVSSETAFSWIRYYGGIEALLKSNVRDENLEALREEGVLAAVREHFAPKTPWEARIRPDHLERFKGFMEAL